MVDGKLHKLREQIILKKTKKHDIDVLVDEIFISEFESDSKGSTERLGEAIERALEESDGLIRLLDAEGKERLISAKFMCPYDGFSFPEVEPRLFSFNSPYGACQGCNGLGTKYFFGSDACPECRGARLRPEALHVYLGKQKTNIVDFVSFSIDYARDFLYELRLKKKKQRKKINPQYL